MFIEATGDHTVAQGAATTAPDATSGVVLEASSVPVPVGAALRAQIVQPSAALELGAFVCAIGVFDGMHEGHQFIIGKMVEQARALGVPAVVITFDQDPDELFLAPSSQRKLLINEDRIDFLAKSGADIVLVIPFDVVFASKEPSEFLDTVIAAQGIPRGIHIGSDFHFGHKARGEVDDLRRWATGHGCEISACQLFTNEGLPVTATRIRNALEAGELTLAHQLLTRPYFLWARVNEGRGMGTTLGFPTANLELEERLVKPAAGVYAGVVAVDGKSYRAAISVGVPATFGQGAPTIEAHLLDFSGDLYGCRLRVFFLEYLRKMRAFANIEELQRAIQTNIAQTQAIPLPPLPL
jgi:riboflavin kinase/FMN adenylyltransferase